MSPPPIPAPGHGALAGAPETHGTPATGSAGRPIRVKEGDLYSGAMDSAMTAFSTQGWLNRAHGEDAETAMRRKIAAAINAYLEETGF